jgi:hypothetical protein
MADSVVRSANAIDVIVQWNDVLLEAIRKNGGAPTIISRVAAMMHIAMFEAVNVVVRKYYSYPNICLTHIHVPQYISTEAAVSYAAYRVLLASYPAQASLIDEALRAALVLIKDDQAAKDNGKVLGEAIAKAVLECRANDGSSACMSYQPRNRPGDWRSNDGSSAVTPEWRNVRPFAMERGNQFRPSFPGGYTEQVELLRSPEYAAQLQEVQLYGSKDSKIRTADQTEIAFFWANDLDGTYKPPGHLFRMTQIVSKLRNLSLVENARLFALVAIVMADAAIVAWDAKYADNYVNLWRPASAVQLADTDGNLVTREDRSWTPLSINPRTGVHFTPSFPAYVSGHATFGAAHAGVMRNYFGTDNVTFELDSDDPSVPYVKRRFNSFSSAALENGRSRVYLGVHYQWDADNGYDSGTKLADFVSAHFLLPLDKHCDHYEAPPKGYSEPVHHDAVSVVEA